MRFEFATANRIVYGTGAVREAGALVASMGKRALIVAGAAIPSSEVLEAQLRARDVTHATLSVPSEPTVELVRLGRQLAQDEACDLVIGFGGGSALDAAKAIAVLLGNEGDPLDYLEVIGRGMSLTRPGLPCVAIPTTAGTGAEVTRNAVLASPAHRVKVSLRSPFLLPQMALVDPELTYSMPPAVSASTGLDALTQLIEPFVSVRANPLTDTLCRDGLARAGRSLRRAYEQGDDPVAREDMALASLFGGLALANAGLGVVHGFASVIGGMFSAPHGAVCARLLPYSMAANVRALQQRQPEGPALQRFDEVARILTGDPQAVATNGVTWLERLGMLLQVPPLSVSGMIAQDIPLVVEKAQVASSTQANPIKLTNDEMSNILAQAL
jgi:alcohol dehydrogenase class IV